MHHRATWGLVYGPWILWDADWSSQGSNRQPANKKITNYLPSPSPNEKTDEEAAELGIKIERNGKQLGGGGGWRVCVPWPLQ